jgi:hypothetical protein
LFSTNKKRPKSWDLGRLRACSLEADADEQAVAVQRRIIVAEESTFDEDWSRARREVVTETEGVSEVRVLRGAAARWLSGDRKLKTGCAAIANEVLRQKS